MTGFGAEAMAAASVETARLEIAADVDVRTTTNVMERDANGMITYEQIAELSDETSLPLIEIIRALARCAGDSEAARAKLMNGGHIDVTDRKVAENLARTLVEEGLCFSCETTPEDHWRFRVPAEYVARACTLTYVSRVQALKAGWKEEASARRAG
jgi:hypothetical protein